MILGVVDSRVLFRGWMVTVFAALAACGGGGDSNSGGGGGGGGSGGGSSLVFSADRTAIGFDFDEGTTPPSQPVTVTAAGTYNGTLYVAALLEGQGLATNIPAQISGTQAVFAVSAASGLAPGDYSGRLQLLACSDSGCTRQVGNSPLFVSYQVHVRPVLKVTPASVSLAATSGVGAQQGVSIQLPAGSTTSTTVLVGGSPWLTLTNVTATGFTVQAASLPSGTYAGSIQVTSGGRTANIPVTYAVAVPAGGDHTLAATPPNLTFSAVEGALSTQSLLGVTAPSWDSQVTMSATYPQGTASGWLQWTAATGGYQVRADATTLSAGTYTSTLLVQGAYPSNPVPIPVALTVGIGLVRPADVSVTLHAESTSAALDGTVPVQVNQGLATNWTASSSAAWLRLPTASGSTGQSLAFHLDASSVAALRNGADHTATITIQPTRTTMTPVTFAVTVRKRLPTITTLGPYVHLDGRPLRVILRGSGFDAIGNPGARFAVQGGSLSGVSRVNDTEVVVQTSALLAGQHAFSVTNALGMPTDQASVTVVAPTSFAAASITTTGRKMSLQFDAERNALYAMNTTLESLQRFRLVGGSWMFDSVAFPAPFDLGLSLDGTRIIAANSSPATGTSAIKLLDPVSLATVSTTPLTGSLGPTFDFHDFGLRTTNDGRTWLALGSGSQWNDMVSFRADDLTVTRFAPGIQTTFHGGPWFLVSRDGERMTFVQSSSLSPSPPMLYMDSADGVARINPAGLTFSYKLSASEDGNRLLFDQMEVRDRDFALIGRPQIPVGSTPSSTYNPLNGLMSMDGNRVYLLAYRNDFYASGAMPRVYVFDSSTRQTTQQELPVLGYFDLAQYPTCVPASQNDGSCDYYSVSGAVSLDSGTLFYAGNARLLVVPVPTLLTPVMAAPPAAQPGIATGRPVAWPLQLR